MDANSLIEGHCKFRDGKKVTLIICSRPFFFNIATINLYVQFQAWDEYDENRDSVFVCSWGLI